MSPAKPARRIALGTVQFGLTYGIANRTGQVSPDEAAAIVAFGRGEGLDTLDTAIAYGESERRLGEIGVDGWHVVTKLPALPDSCTDAAAWVRESVAGSLARLRTRRIAGLLLHRSQDLLGAHGAAIYAAMEALRADGIVEKIGVSVYAPPDLAALAGRYRLDLVQAPFSVVDRRLATSGWLSRLHDAGTEIHVRSLFLQGLLLMDDDERPARFDPWNSLWIEWRRWLRSENLTPIEACLSFALSHPEISRLVVGADTLEQVRQIVAGATSSHSPRSPAPATLASEDLDLINPLHWITK